MRQNKSIFYVNYSPYENAGKVLNYLLGNYHRVYLFSVGFHYLGENQQTNRLIIYEYNKAVKKVLFKSFPIKRFVFFLLPVRSVLNFIQLVKSVIAINKTYGKIDQYFSVNGFTTWIGIILRRFGLVKKVIYWVWDYYPINHEKVTITIIRWIYWIFDKWGAKSDRIVFLNKRLLNKWKQSIKNLDSKKLTVVPIGTDGVRTNQFKVNKKNIRVAFIGVIKKSQGLEILLKIEKELKDKFPNINFDIIGHGPDFEYFKKLFRKSGLKVNLHGFVEEQKFGRILKKCSIGIAPYIPIESNVSKYGDPAKIKWYLSYGIPSIITDIFEFSKTLELKGAGVVINYHRPQELVGAIEKILRNYNRYRVNSFKLAKELDYRKIYPNMFNV